MGVGLVATAVLGWIAKEVVFEDRSLAALYVLLGLAATLASAFEAWRRWAAAGVLGLVVAATALAAQGDSLVEGRNFFAAIVVGHPLLRPRDRVGSHDRRGGRPRRHGAGAVRCRPGGGERERRGAGA